MLKIHDQLLIADPAGEGAISSPDCRLKEDLAAWRGENVGIIFQFFQMLPALSLLQNVILPMDLANKYKPKEYPLLRDEMRVDANPEGTLPQVEKELR